MNYLTTGLIKKMDMKNIVLNLTLLISIFFIESCVPEAVEIDRQYQLINKSETNIRIKFFNTFSNDLYVIQLSKDVVYLGDVLTYRSGNTQLNENNSSFPTRALKDSDSLKMIFDNTKYLISKYTSGVSAENAFSSPINRNLFRHGNYEEIEKERFQFKITQQDYENAEDCNGNCD